MVKQQLLEDLKKAVSGLGFSADDIVCSIPQNPAFGDYTTNSALQLAKLKSAISQQTPEEIAKKIVSNLSDLSYLSKVEIAGGGFINFFIKGEFLAGDLEEILKKGQDFGKNDQGKGQKIQIEFISANPTGPLTLANGRGGAIGETLSQVLAWNGYLVEKEYYINDTGNQVRLLGESVLARAGKLPVKEEYYKGDYIQTLAEKFKDKLDLQGQALEPQELGHFLADYLLEREIKPSIAKLGIKFEEFYSERSLYKRGLIEETVKLLKEKGLAFEKEGALWFASTKFGDEKDRVLMTSQEQRGRMEPTYFLADIAHHLDVLKRGYIRRIIVLGADHYEYGERMKKTMEILGFGGKLEVILMQMVKLFQEGKEIRMSKRAGTYVTLDELLESVGSDVAKFFFLMYAPSSHINFNLELAKEKSSKNPVFYVQYAYARMSNILKKSEVLCASKTWSGKAKLNKKEELKLIKHLSQFPDLLEEISKNYQVQGLTTFAITLADLFHRFYEECPVLQAEPEELKSARLALVSASRIVLGNVLSIMGIRAPERM